MDPLLSLSPFDPSRPLMVSGNGRSGTTAVARVCAALGLRHYWDPRSQNAEDELTDAWLNRDLDMIRRTRLSRSAGWIGKVPGAIHLAHEDRRFAAAADCNWLLTVRDPCAEAAHDQQQRPGESVWLSMHRRVQMAAQITEAIKWLGPQTGVAIVSYERLLLSTGPTVQAIADWICRPYAPEAVQEIVPADPRYTG